MAVENLKEYAIRTLVIAIALLANGCLPTKNRPFATGDLLFDPILEGRWAVLSGPDGNTKSSFIDIAKRGDHYEAKWEKADGPGDAYFFRYNNRMYLSMSTAKSEQDININYHTCMLTVSGESLKIWSINKNIEDKIALARDLFFKNPQKAADDPSVKLVGKLVGSETPYLQSVVLNQPAKDGYAFNHVYCRAIPIGRRLSDSRLCGKSQRTMDYWVESDIIIKSMKKGDGSDEKFLKEEFTRISESLKSLPTLGVDLEAVSCRLSLAQTLDEAIEYFNKGNRVLDVLVRTLNGDPFGTGLDLVQEHKQIVQKFADAKKQTETARALLTAKYDAEYP